MRSIAELYAVSDERKRLHSMEGLRGVAVLLVFFVHFHALFGVYAMQHDRIFDISRFLGNIGNTGVDLFFVLSGYLIYGTLLKKHTPVLKFIGRRVERIYPTFLVVFAIYLLLSFFFPADNKIHGPMFPALLYILQNALLLPGIFNIPPIITVAWSLSYEFFFYLVIPVVVWITQMRQWKRVWRVVFFICLWLVYVSYAFSVTRSQVRLLMFVGGILLFEAMESDWFKDKLTKKGEFVAALLFLASLAFVYLYDAQPDWFSMLPAFGSGRTVLPGVPTFQGPYKVLVLSITCPLFCLYCFRYEGFLNRIFSWNPFRYLGNISYSYYLIHGLALQVVARAVAHLIERNNPNLLVFLLCLPAGFLMTWIVSSLLFLCVEKPFSFKTPSQPPQAAPRQILQENAAAEQGR